LYPVLVVKAGVTSSMLAASYATVMVFWSYKIVFGFLSDCFPIFGYKRKLYIAIGVSLRLAFSVIKRKDGPKSVDVLCRPSHARFIPEFITLCCSSMMG